MKLYNTLTRNVEDFTPLKAKTASIYSCGPTVYDHIHIGNLSAFIAADTLRRTLSASSFQTTHVMNFTDVDDKTIRRSQEQYPEDSPEVALSKLTLEYRDIFLADMRQIGNDVDAIKFVSAVKSIPDMCRLITKLYKAGFAYITDDGAYFSIEKYRASGKVYGQLTEVSESSTAKERIANDEYDKDSAHDFALWKTRKDNEPAWEFTLDGHSLLGRPGWHIECSAMSASALGQPFDIHTGGVDLIFPHHENEIAQSTATEENPAYAKYFVHNEHLLVNGKKMSKSLNNFYTLTDIMERKFEPLAFRLLVLQSHYRAQTHFSWDNLDSAQNRLKRWRAVADLRYQLLETSPGEGETAEILARAKPDVLTKLQDDLSTPEALAEVDSVFDKLEDGVVTYAGQYFNDFLTFIDEVLGLKLTDSADITDEQKRLIAERQKAREAQDWAKSDELRDQLKDQDITVRDTPNGPLWSRV